MTDAVRLTPARTSLGWRPLVRFWLCVLCVAGLGGAALQWLGPPSDGSVGDPVRSPQQSARPGEPGPREVTSASPATSPPAPFKSDEPNAASNQAKPLEPVEPAVMGAVPASPSGSPPPPPDQDERPPAKARSLSDAQALGAFDQTPPHGGQAVVILHAAGSQGGQAAAEQLASRVGLTPDQIKRVGLTPDQINTRAAADVPSRAIIRFYTTEDHAWARRLGQELSQMGYSWRIENWSDRSSSPEHQVPEVWLPER